MQLGEDIKIKWLSSSSQWLWAVDSSGRCLMRSGVPDNDIMISAWLPVENPNDEVNFKEVGDRSPLGAIFVRQGSKTSTK